MAEHNSTTLTAPSDIPAEGKHTRYNRETMDYDGFYDGRYLGSREDMNAARDMVNEYAYDLMVSGELYTAQQMDAPVEPTYADQFAVGFQHGQEIAAILNDPAPNLPERIKAWIDRRLAEEEVKNVTRIPATLATMPSIEAQIAATPPYPTNGKVDILAVTLPTGEELTRCTFNGAPADWVEIRRGDTAIDIKGDGSISGVLIGDNYIDDVAAEDWEDLRQLLAVDRQAIGTATKMPAHVVDAMYTWNHQPYEQWKRLHETVGFGAWYEKRRRLQVKAA